MHWSGQQIIFSDGQLTLHNRHMEFKCGLCGSEVIMGPGPQSNGMRPGGTKQGRAPLIAKKCSNVACKNRNPTTLGWAVPVTDS